MQRRKHLRVRGWLARGMTRAERRLNRRLIESTYQRFLEYIQQLDREQRRAAHDVPSHARRKWLADANADRRQTRHAPLRMVVDFLRFDINRRTHLLHHLFARNAEFRRSYARVVDQREADQLILDYAVELGSTRWQQQGDQRALRRWLNDEALNDRFLRLTGEHELELMFMVDRFGFLVDHIVHKSDGPKPKGGRVDSIGYRHHCSRRSGVLRRPANTNGGASVPPAVARPPFDYHSNSSR